MEALRLHVELVKNIKCYMLLAVLGIIRKTVFFPKVNDGEDLMLMKLLGHNCGTQWV